MIMSLTVLSQQTNWSTAQFPPQGLMLLVTALLRLNQEEKTVESRPQWQLNPCNILQIYYLYLSNPVQVETYILAKDIAAFCVKLSFLPPQF